MLHIFIEQVHPSTSTLDSSTTELTLQGEGVRVGVRRGAGRVLLRELPLLTGAVPLATKRGLLRLRDHVAHDHLTRFHGLYLHEDTRLYSSVTQFCPKGDLQQLLRGTK